MLKLSGGNYTNIRIKVAEQWKNVNIKFNKKIKGTIFERWVLYWKQIGRDYTDVTISLKHEMKNKPLKTAVYLSGIGILSYCATHNPNLQNFRAKYVQCANDLALVSPTVTNPESVNHLKYIESCFNRNLIRYTNLGIASIIWVQRYNVKMVNFHLSSLLAVIPFTPFWDKGHPKINLFFCDEVGVECPIYFITTKISGDETVT
ncbi:hypothetical protein NQ318_018114 [Aromia moschata]|uniref:Uncharacterized protein n=1 Tax=Aromia moschata TaxID=1265417 RepID=A0AAV8ZCT9_9CUCU|nr:hypothetical protein NQ318_018114 [Aromia moschata]